MLPLFESLEKYFVNLSDMELDSSTDSVLSDDIWNKFELEEPETSIFDDLELYCPHDTRGVVHTLLNHDCMWGGGCSHVEHPKARRPLDTPPLQEKAPVKLSQSQVLPGRSLLLKPLAKPVVSSDSPDSPPISDDEEMKGPTSTLKMLNDAINECELEEDSDLCEYFGEDGDLIVKDEPEEEEEDEEEEEEKPVLPPPPPPKPVFQPQIDHSYHKDKNASMRIANLGIETPSDSEEEIDVVSVGEKSRVGYGLPTNPSSQYQEHLERTVECAIGSRRPQGIKTLPPVRRYAVEASPKKRGVKRARHGCGSSQPYKRRAVPSTQCSDSDEPELERRSLHNNMERQRRIDLRNAFEDLKTLVPRLNQMERAAKVQILQDSRDYCYHLADVNEGLQRKVHELRRQQQRLHARVSQLRRNLANKKKLE